MKNLEIRTVEKFGIKITLKIDYDRGKVSMVERNADGTFVPKRWTFADRELEYMGGWMQILHAMQFAVDEATKELEKLQEQNDKKEIDAIQMLERASKVLNRKPRKKKI